MNEIKNPMQFIWKQSLLNAAIGFPIYMVFTITNEPMLKHSIGQPESRRLGNHHHTIRTIKSYCARNTSKIRTENLT